MAIMAEERQRVRAWEILLVEDNPADIRLTEEVLGETSLRHTLRVARDGEQALNMIRRAGDYSNQPEPDLVLLDLNLPRKDGRAVLTEIKGDPELSHIPIIVLSTSRADRDVRDCYSLHANAYLQKPLDLDAFADLMRGVEDFWLRRAALPPKRQADGND